MSSVLRSHKQSWLWRSLPLLILVIGLGWGPVAQAAQDDYATITVTAPDALAGSPVEVQYLDASGQWIVVNGWKGTLDGLTGVLGPYKKWTVYKANFGQGPFRWVVYSHDGKSVWGISDAFNLPSRGGIDLPLTIIPGVTGTETTTAGAGATTNAPVASGQENRALLLKDTGRSTFTLSCRGQCHSSIISAYFSGLPSTIWIAVEWGDGNGHWTAVHGWQGPADWVNSATGQMVKIFSVAPANYRQGPFRWAVYDGPGGTLLGYSLSFKLPARGGQNYFMSLSR